MEKPSDAIIERAVEIWCRALRKPFFDNGDNSMQGILGSGMASMLIEQDKKKFDTDSCIEKFRNVLVEELKELRDNSQRGYLPSLSTDYHPDKILADAADAAGIPHSQFSIKSSVYIHKDSVSASFGYGAEHIRHYPLPDGRWLVTDIYGGDDFSKVIDNVINGNSLGLNIDDE